MEQVLHAIIAWDPMAKNNGFTYIELLIVMSVMALLAVIGRSSYLELNLRKQAERETKKLVSLIDLAQSKTRSHEKACDDYAGYYLLNVSEGTDGIFTSRVIPQGCDTQDTYSFPSGFEFPEGSFTLQYDTLGTSVTGTSCIIVMAPKNRYCGKITIQPSGAISDEMLTEGQCVCP